DPLVPLVEAGFRLAADAFDLDGIRTFKADAVKDSSDAAKVDTAAGPDGRKIPVLKPTSAVLDVDAANQMLDLLQLVSRVDALVVVADVPRVEVEPHVGMAELLHQGEHCGGVLSGPLMRLEGDGDPLPGRSVADSPQVCEHALALVGVGRLPCARNDH